MLFACFVGPALVATPLWAKISRAYGKQRLLLLAQSFFVIGALLLVLGRPGGLPYMLLLGVAFAGMQLFPFSMLPDTVKAAGEAGQRNAGAFTGLWTATEATGAALGPYLYAAALALGGFISTKGNESVAPSDTAVTAIRLAFSLLPAALMIVAIVLQRRYSLDRERPGAGVSGDATAPPGSRRFR